jgi:ribonuclease HI
MLISIDGACKRNGEPTCSSCGVAWIQTEDEQLLYKANYESTGSTSQRGELQGLIAALDYARFNSGANEIISIITDSEYLFNTVSKEWVNKWYDNKWIGSEGVTIKNVDMWQHVYSSLQELNADGDRVFMQWTKGHIMSYTPGNIKRAMMVDATGVELYSRILAMGGRPADKGRIISDFKMQRTKHDHLVPDDETCFKWCMANVMADCLTSFLVTALDGVML